MGEREIDPAARAPGRAFELRAGATPLRDTGGVRFRVWSPDATRVSVRIIDSGLPNIPLARLDDGAFEGIVPGARAGSDYVYAIDRGERHIERPDPVSRWQPRGVHGPSRVVDPRAFAWTDAEWRGIALEDHVIYELHVGTFTPEGTFAAVAGRLEHLRALGVTAIEIMPVAQFPGERNWGYDGVFLYAPQASYGGPEGLKTLVDACHRAGLAVILDVVYNHLGPEGNYLRDFGPYFTDRYRTPWGDALNFDGAESDGVRRFFVENALHWLTEYHVDALRLDAVHQIIDLGARHVLEDVAAAFHAEGARLGRQAHIIAESDLNDPRLLRPVTERGLGIDAQWSDDFHHSAHALLTGARRGYFGDYGRVADLAKAVVAGFVYDGRYQPSRKRRHGASSADRPGHQLVTYVQNHDQVANGSWGARLSTLVSLEPQKLAAALLALAPSVPMLFMGQEYGETAPFLYFTSHEDPALADAVRRGREAEHAEFADGGASADPQSPVTFERSKLGWHLVETAPHAFVLALYRDLLRLRRDEPCLRGCRKDLTRATANEPGRWLVLERGAPGGARAIVVFNLSGSDGPIPLPPGAGRFRLALATSDHLYGGPANGPRPPATLDLGAGEHVDVRLPGFAAALYLQSEL